MHLITSSVSVKERAGRKFDLGPQQTLGKMLERSVRHDGISFGILYKAVTKNTLPDFERLFEKHPCPPAPSRAGARITIELAPLRTGSRSPGQRERRETASEGENSSRMDLRMGFWSTRRMNRWDGANTARGRSFPVSTTTPAIDDLPVKAAQ